MKDADQFIDNYKDVANFNYYGMENWTYNFIESHFQNMKADYEKLRVGYYDIETECENGFPDPAKAEEEITIISITYKDKLYAFSTEKHGKFQAHKPNVISITFATEELMMKAFIKFLSQASYDVLTGWNSDGFDLPYIVNRVRNLLGNEWVKKLSPWGIVREKTIPNAKGDVDTYEIYGINHIDYMTAYMKFSGKKPDNYRLDTVGEMEIKEKKLDYSEYGSLHTLYLENWQKFGEYNVQDTLLLQKIEDKTHILELIFDMAMNSKVNPNDTFRQTRIWDSIFYSYLKERKIIIPSKPDTASKIKFEGGYVKDTVPGMYDWVVSFDLDGLYPHLIMHYNISPETLITRKKLTERLNNSSNEEERFAAETLLKLMDGKDYIDVPLPDGTRMYPKEITDSIKVLNYSFAGNGAMFDRSFRGFIPELMDKFYNERRMFKGKMIEEQKRLEDNRSSMSAEEIRQAESNIAKFNVAQNNRKTSLNSAYGSLSQVGFRFFMLILARAITISGQMSIRWAEVNLNEFFNEALKTKDIDYCTAVDTDSAHFSLDALVKIYLKKKPDATKIEICEFLDKFAEAKIQPQIQKLYSDLQEYMNGYEQKMKMKREAIADRGVYLAKKKYIYNVYNLEGVKFYEKPKIKVTGVEIVRSSTPEFCRKRLEEASRIILQEDVEKLRTYMTQVQKDFMALSVEEASKPTGVKGIDKYYDEQKVYKSKTPIHVRGSLMFNKLIDDLNLGRKYQKITEGDKVRFTYLEMPNHTFENVIAFPNQLPEEFKLHEYVDMKSQYEKTFFGPLKSITEAAGWSLEDKNTLDDLFE